MIRPLTRRGIAALAIAFALAAPALAASPLTIRIGYAAIGVGNRPYADQTSVATARAGQYVEKAFAQRPDVKIEWYFFKGAGPAVNEAIANGQLDFAYQGDLPSLIGRANGLRTKLLLASGAHKPVYLAVQPSSDIKGVQDLKGRRVALQRGTNNQLAVDKVLAAKGLSERDLKIVNMDSAAATAALAAKEIDAAFGDTELIRLEQQGVARIAYTTKGDDPRLGRNGAFLVTEAFVAAHPEETQTVVDAVVAAARWSSEEANREALFQLWTTSGIPADINRAYFADESLAWRHSPLFDDFMRSQYAEQGAAALEYGLLRRPVDQTGWIDTSYLERAQKAQHLENFWQRYGADGKPLGS
ncbi:sulfonate transport system substrate-binding protein [Arboricoccus pini]|uniref:Sulfonate transport system substrate-binding protein n=1 Tax=Arboricoccus pini TaxID=1963835 RepID=A0A212RFP3_9PROT|nr:ABC transporter substrate-binding protein [Arboricoccus pini]SNB71108.1 sulfonate transport system substrate-binding protein [Arboricoccus pini]